MADTVTPHYGWTKPEPSGSSNTWGVKQNGVFDQIDAQVFANQQAGAPIGSGMLWFAAAAPANWLICNGQSLLTVGTYAALFAIIGYTYGGSGANFNLPNFTDRFGIGAGANPLGGTGGVSIVTLTAAQIPAHTHPLADPGHVHGVSQTPHAHPDPGHVHSASQDPHNHTYVRAQVSGQTGTQAGFNTGTLTDVVSTAQPAVHIGAAATGIQSVNANISINGVATGATVAANTGGGGPHENRPPYLAINMIIRFQ
jgi:microcystin-dependent protein